MSKTESAKFTVSVKTAIKHRLKKLAKIAGRSSSVLVTEAVLRNNPEFGRTGRVAGTRELVIPKTPFIVLYRVNGQSLEILRIYHAAQRRPELKRSNG
jgi:toxin ParE1/3/4